MDSEDRLDMDFMFYLSVSERNWKNLTTEEDKALAQTWLYKLTALQQTKAEKRDRNVYLSQLALAMGEGELSGPFIYRPPEGNLPAPSDVFGPPQPRIEVPVQFRKVDKSEDLTTSYTSKDGRTYVATKSLGKDHGAYTYIGISLAETEPLWIGGDAPFGPCDGFERHFVKPQTVYSKPRPRASSTIFAMEREGGSGDTPDDTRIFTDYVTAAIEAQMSGTHSQDFQERKTTAHLPMSGTHSKEFQERRKTVQLPAEEEAEKEEKPREELDIQLLIKQEPVDEEEADLSPKSLQGLDAMYPSLQEVGTAAPDSQIDVSNFYTQMITNLNNSLSGKDDLNEYNKEKAEEIKETYAKENTQLETLEALKRTKKALLKKLNRVRDEESRLSDSIKTLEILRSPSSTDDLEEVIEIWKEACKLHDKKNLRLLEEVYNQTVRERVADMMTQLKLRAVNERSKHLRLQAAAAREDFITQSNNLEERIKVAEDLIDRIQEVLNQMVSVKAAAPRENPVFVQRRKLAERLEADVEQLTDMFNIEYDTCRSLEREIFNRADRNVFSNPEFASLSVDNQKLLSNIKEMKTHMKEQRTAA